MNRGSKKILKISVIVLLSVLFFIFISFGIISWLLFSRKGIDKTTKYAIENYAPCRIETGNIELTLFKTFPRFSLEVNDVIAFNDLTSAPTDTLASIDRLYAELDLKALIKEKIIVIKSINLDNTQLFVFRDSLGHSVLDCFSDSTESVVENNEPFDISQLDSIDLGYSFDVNHIGLNNTRISLIDQQQRIETKLVNIDAIINGRIDSSAQGDLNLKVNIDKIISSISDSVLFNSSLYNIELDAVCHLRSHDSDIDGIITINNSSINYDSIFTSISSLKLGFNANATYLDNQLNVKSELITNSINTYSKDIKLSLTNADLTMTANAGLDFKTAIISLSTVAETLDFSMIQNERNYTEVRIKELGLDCDANAEIASFDGNANILLTGSEFYYIVNGDTSQYSVRTPFKIDISAEKKGNNINTISCFDSLKINLISNGETYMDNIPLSLNLPIITNIDFNDIILNDALLTINDQKLGFGANYFQKSNKDSKISAYASLIDVDIKKVLNMIPEDYQSMIDGIYANGNVNAKVMVDADIHDQMIDVNFADSHVSSDKFSLSYNDSLFAQSDKIDFSISYPGEMSTATNSSVDIFLKTGKIYADVLGTTPISTTLSNINLSGYLNGFMNGLNNVEALFFFNSKLVNASLDSISTNIEELSLSTYVGMNTGKNGNPDFYLDFKCDTLSAEMGSSLSSNIGKTDLFGEIQIDTTQKDILLKYSPILTIKMNNASVENLGLPIMMPKLDLDFNLGKFKINNSSLTIGQSDMNLTGSIDNLGDWLNGVGSLNGDMNLVSGFTNMTELMDLVSGFGVDTSDSINSKTHTQDQVDANPFIVPLGVNVTLNTHINEMEFNNHLFNDLGGDITVKDGALVLQELGFSSNAAKMQLTAIYKTPKPDNIYMGLDFHLLDIEVAELISLIPTVDTIVPMLKSFDGKAQFHLTAETELDQYYSLRMPTFIGAAAIEGKDLVILDNDVFNSIKHKLLMSKHAENKIDSLSVELQVIRNKVDLYPFLVHMDRYSAVIGGRHNINKDLDCRYHISLTECPLPIRLGVTVSGPINGISENPLKHIHLAKCDYKRYYKPQKEGLTEERTLKMKQDILNILRSNVREQQ